MHLVIIRTCGQKALPIEQEPIFNHFVSNLILDPLLACPDYLFTSSMYLLTECIHLFVRLPASASLLFLFPSDLHPKRFENCQQSHDSQKVQIQNKNQNKIKPQMVNTMMLYASAAFKIL